MAGKRRVSYFYDGDVGNYYYGPGHPMKPHRLKLTHHLLLTYGLYRKMEVYRPHMATAEEMARFHSDEYVDFLRRVTPDTMNHYVNQLTRFGTRGAEAHAVDNIVETGFEQLQQVFTGGTL